MAWLSRFDDFNVSCDTEPSGNKYNAAPRMKAFDGTSKKPFPPKIPFESNSGQDLRSPPKGYHQINAIATHLQSVSIIGVIIAKDGPKTFLSKKGGNERHLLALTVRDSPSSFINVTCWCGEEFIQSTAPDLNIGTVVDIRGANVQAKSNNPSDDKFKPWTPSLCQLNLSDNQGTIGVYHGPDVSHYLQFLNIPTKANNDFYTLEDIQANGMSLNGEHINILAAVKKIWPVRNIVSKTGVNLTKADIVVCDETCPSFNLTLWGNCVQLTEKWVPMETVVFAADVRISFNDFRSTMVANTDSKTIITTSPDTYEALSLQEFIRSQSSMFCSTNEMDQFAGTSKDPDVETITKVLTVRQIKDLQRTLDNSGENTDYAVTYAFLSQFDCDSDNKTIFRDICSRCKKPVQESTSFICGNPTCAGGDLNFDGISSMVEYRLSVTLSDHTGSLEFCSLSIQTAEDILGYKANEYKNLAGLERTNIKWNYLLERVRAVLKIMKLKKGNENGCYVKVIAIRKATPAQLLEQGFMDI